MNRELRHTIAAACLVTAGCTWPDADVATGDEWVGEIRAEGNVTTVVNTSGSVWGGTATLVEEASIGVEAGEDPYMLGQVTAIAASAGKILVADQQVPALRVYDFAGKHLYDIGGPGQGPGEYQRLSSVAIGSDGRVFVRDDRASQILIYDEEGVYLTAYRKADGLSSSRPLVLSVDDVPYTVVIGQMLTDDPNRLWQLGVQAHGEDGPTGEPILQPIDENFEPVTLRNEDGNISRRVPFSPEETWTLTRRLDVISGVPTTYRFQVQRTDGSRLIVEKHAEPVAVDPDEAAWHRRKETAAMRSIVPEWTWNATEVPSVKPPYRDFVATRSGAIWVRRAGPGFRVPDCDESADTPSEFSARPCWDETTLIDVFDDDGRFLGALDLPPGFSMSPQPYIDEDLVIARVDDELGISRVKRYRVVRPS